ncbi:protein of unknown function (plasmid) [Caballeronia sp. S22]
MEARLATMQHSHIASHDVPAIELDRVSRRFISPDGKAILALQNFNMTVAKGEFCAVVGPTGCGKSTTLSLVTGLAKPSSGTFRIWGKPVDDINRRIGLVAVRRSLPVEERTRQCRSWPALSWRGQGTGVRAGNGMDPARGARAIRASLSTPAFGRHAQAHRARADLRQRARNAADG